ncbi:hypothetical protein GCM10010307_26280 [Streptomyces vastus]|uniref:Uncharacterized protein n=1 Tax=Streptomyces vastus TaxID=285451 RepID=A0ABP6D2Z4_9ACTN
MGGVRALRGRAPPEVSDFDLAWLERGDAVRKPLGYACHELRHVGFESWLERDHAISMDFEPRVTWSASQPF